MREAHVEWARKTHLPGKFNLHHIGIAVRDIESAMRMYETLGIQIAHQETVLDEKVRIAILLNGNPHLELIQPLDETSHLTRFLARRGDGLHHVALEVDDIEKIWKDMQSRGIRATNDAIRIGANGQKYFFLHPSSAGGLLLEIVQSIG